MIWNVTPWLLELEENAKSINAALAALGRDKDAADFDLFFLVEKALLMSAFTIRKLHENGEFSARADETLISAMLYPVRGDKKALGQIIRQFGSILPHAVCDLSAPSHEKIKIRQACNYIIHSDMVAYSDERPPNRHFFWVFKGNNMSNFVKVGFDTWLSIIQQVPDLLKHSH